MTFYEWLVGWLVAVAAVPQAAPLENAQAAAAVMAARASLAPAEPGPAPAPTPADCVCGGTCKNGVWKPDGRIEQVCTCKCARCIKRPALPCPDGKCPPK
jgi:hypothetical protein